MRVGGPGMYDEDDGDLDRYWRPTDIRMSEDPCFHYAVWCIGGFLGALVVGAVLGRFLWWGIHEGIALAARVMM